MKNMLFAIYFVTIISGFLSFYIVGGIPKLASDVGISGAWGLALFIQLIYATLISIGFTIYMVLVNNFISFKATIFSVSTTSLLISSSINIFGVFYTGQPIDTTYGALVVIAASLSLFFINSFICSKIIK